MSEEESSSEKTEQPTPKKERDAREKGQVARSVDLVSTVSLFGVIGTMWVFADTIWTRLITMMDTVAFASANVEDGTLIEAIVAISREMILSFAPILGATIVFAILPNYIQIGGLLAIDGIIPQWERVSVSKGFERIFHAKTLIETPKSAFKIVFLSVLLFFVIASSIGPYSMAVNCGMPCLMKVTAEMLWLTLSYSFGVFAIVAWFDFLYQKHIHTKTLMMTPQEVKREYKENEGDPRFKDRRRDVAKEVLLGDEPKKTRRATAVITNPVHFAVAIRYEQGDTPLPVVIAKGRNRRALAIRTEAELAGVPIFANPPVARLLHAETEVGEFVPDEVFDVVAEILAWVARHKEALYNGPLDHGALDMESGDHLDGRPN